MNPIASYHYIWAPGTYTLQEAEDICLHMGMHLVSISSQLEYELVTDMLLGAGYYRNGSTKAQLLLTPCRLGNVMCIIYLG